MKRLLAILVLVGCGGGVDRGGGASAQKTSEAFGAWESTEIHHMSEHAALLAPSGKLLLWGWLDDTRPAIFDPTVPPAAEGGPSDARWRRIDPPPGPDVVFHAGHTQLPDGRLLIVGGGPERQRSAFAFHLDPEPTFDPVGTLSTARFYPTPVLLATGEVLVASGDYVSEPGSPGSPGSAAEIYEPDQDLWVPIVDRSRPDERLPSDDVFPATYVLPSGRLAYLPVAEDFSGPLSPTRLLSLDGGRVTKDTFGPVEVHGAVVSVPSTTDGWAQPRAWRAIKPALGARKGGSSVMLVDDRGDAPVAKVLALGGGDATADLVDFTNELVPTVTRSSLAFARGHHTGLVPLPSGEVLALDGSLGDPVPPELFDGHAWRTAGPAPTFARGEHEIAVAIPDGRVVLSSDGAVPNHDRRSDETIEIFRPPYTRGARPALASAPDTASPRGTATLVTTATSRPIAGVCLIRPAAVTHGSDSGRRRIDLQVTAVDPHSVRVRWPDAQVAPPGYYLLYVVDDAKTPSVGRFVKLAAR